MPVTKIASTWSSGNLVFKNKGALTDNAIHFGVDGTGIDVKFFGDTASSYALWDQSADALTFVASRILFSSVTTNTDGALLKAGTSASPVDGGTTANRNFMQAYLTSAATTGDCRGFYLRLYLTGAGGAGEALRVFTTGSGSIGGGTVNGAHISLSGATGANFASGAANALRATFSLGANVAPNGTVSSILVDTDLNATCTVPTLSSFLRLVNVGTKKFNNFLNIPNVAAETNGLFCAHTTQTMSHSIRIISADGTAYYIMCSDTKTNRTES